MKEISLVSLALALSAAVSEFALRGRKVQSALGPALAVWIAAGGCLLLWFWGRPSGWASFAVFWAGAFLSWFGIRSHLESSILLRMVYLLKQRPKTSAELLEEYERSYGSQQRVEELVRAGLLERRGEHLLVTPKGKLVLSVARLLRG
jgi:hypothetical protein